MEPTLDDIIDMFERSDMDKLASFGGIDGLARTFKTDLANGISKAESDSNFHERIQIYGANKLPDPPTKSWFNFFFDALKDLTIIVLLVASVVAAIIPLAFNYDNLKIDEFIDTISIIITVLVVSCVTAQTNFAQQKSFIEINKLKNSFPVTVIRHGEKIQIDSTDVLVGDILEIKTGDCVCADCLLIRGTNVTVNNSASTGEPVAVKVNDSNPFLKGNGAVESGIGLSLVCAVGKNSQSGVLMTKIQQIEQEAPKSPLQKKLDNLVKLLTYIAITGALVCFAVLLVIWGIDIKNKVFAGNTEQMWKAFVEHIMTALTIFLCSIPEGLPLAVTLALSFSMKKMMDDNNFVRKMNACETMGGATTVCSDKTGTLTQNKMTVVKYFMDGEVYDGKPDLNKNVLDILADSISINSTATHTLREADMVPLFVGSSSECALLQMIIGYGKDYQEIREKANILYLNEFNSARKRMSTVVLTPRGYRVFFKGAPDFCLPLCKYYTKKNGEVATLKNAHREKILSIVNEFACESLRTMLIAYRDLGMKKKETWEDPNVAESELTIIGIVGIMDPLRPEVPDAVETFKKAGVVVRMVTGDFIATARAISKQCGIIESENDIIMEGRDFAKMSKTELVPMLDRIRVLARSSPTDKLRLVTLLMECGEVVAVTGDGSNDSAALKKANVGLAMGQCGTELAKIASDIVILDDNFSSIVHALKWGRCVYNNLRSFLQFQIPVNFVAFFVCIVGSIYFHESPLKPIQILWLNLINDSLGAIALATRKPMADLLTRPPYGESDNIISNVLLRNIILHTLYQTFVLLLILFAADYFKLKLRDGRTRIYIISSWIFNTFVFMNIFNLINARVSYYSGNIFDEIFINYYFIVIFLVIAVVQITLIYVGSTAFHCIAPNGMEWLITLAFSVGEILFGFVVRLIPLKDHTLTRLNQYREMKKKQVVEHYSKFTTEQQWDERYALGSEIVAPTEVAVKEEQISV